MDPHLEASTAIARAARHVRDEEFAIEVVVVADDAAAPSWHLSLERSLDPDEADRSLGWDDYCLSLTDGASTYGCLREVDLQPSSLRLDLTEQGSADLGLESQELSMALDLDPDQHAGLVAGLRSILAASPSAPRLGGLLAQP
ncbi:MAG: Imm10 family immunity protein [Sporichthyaceae bacterium]